MTSLGIEVFSFKVLLVMGFSVIVALHLLFVARGDQLFNTRNIKEQQRAFSPSHQSEQYYRLKERIDLARQSATPQATLLQQQVVPATTNGANCSSACLNSATCGSDGTCDCTVPFKGSDCSQKSTTTSNTKSNIII